MSAPGYTIALRLKRGILAQADQSVLIRRRESICCQNEIVDALLDAAAMGSYTVRRGPTFRHIPLQIHPDWIHEPGGRQPSDRKLWTVLVCASSYTVFLKQKNVWRSIGGSMNTFKIDVNSSNDTLQKSMITHRQRFKLTRNRIKRDHALR